MLQHTRNNRRQTFDRISGSVFLHDVSDRVRPLFNGTGTVRAKLAHAFAEGGRTLGVDNQLLPMRLLDPLWEGAHDSTSRPRLPRHRRAVEANPTRVRLVFLRRAIMREFDLQMSRDRELIRQLAFVRVAQGVAAAKDNSNVVPLREAG